MTKTIYFIFRKVLNNLFLLVMLSSIFYILIFVYFFAYISVNRNSWEWQNIFCEYKMMDWKGSIRPSLFKLFCKQRNDTHSERFSSFYFIYACSRFYCLIQITYLFVIQDIKVRTRSMLSHFLVFVALSMRYECEAFPEIRKCIFLKIELSKSFMNILEIAKHIYFFWITLKFYFYIDSFHKPFE